MDKYTEMIKGLIKKQEKILEKLNQSKNLKEFDKESMCLKADYLDGGTFKIKNAFEDILTPKVDSEIEDDK